ncbi:serine hydrolase domain-containing protein [Micromonospora sp. NPDC002296]|uniref:serine hydrolase domain-containing protein n=1 Tax=Micromonospora sp. NPDC002296 TaxID=3154271 RepID=UPI00332EAAFE
MTQVEARGLVAPGYEEVARAFARNFEEGAEVGAAVTVYRRGRPVVELWRGVANPETGRPWRRDTMAVLASLSKTLVTGAALMLTERGVLDLDVPVAHWWPEFAAEGKGGITLRMVLSHRSGVVALDHRPITYEALRTGTPVVEALAAARPEWPPGTAHGYHATTFGHLVGELVRRTTGLTVGRFVAREIAGPLGLDCHIGLPADAVPRLATSLPSQAETLMSGGENPGTSALLAALADPASLAHRVSISSMAADPMLMDEVTRVQVENPSYDGVASATALARFFAALIGEVDGVRLIGPGLVAELRRVHSTGPCRCLLLPATWGLGVMVPDGPQFPADAGLGTAFGLSGANGAFAFADPEHELSFGYLPNRGSAELGVLDARTRRLVAATYRSLADAA